MKYSIIPLLLFSASVLASPPELCNDLAESTVNITFDESTLSEDMSKSKRQLTRMMSSKQLYGRDAALGLLNSKANVLTKLSVATLQTSSDLCASHVVDVTISYEFTLYVAKEVQRNQCAFDFIHNHEMTHVEIYNQFIVDNKESITAIIQSKYSDYIFGNPADVRKQYQSIAVDIRKDVMYELEKVGAIHEAFDRSDFDATEKVCGGALSRM